MCNNTFCETSVGGTQMPNKHFQSRDFFFQIAGHSFRLSCSDQDIEEELFRNYAPFQLTEGVDEYLFHLSVRDSALVDGDYELVGQFDDDIARIGIWKSTEGAFRFKIVHPE